MKTLDEVIKAWSICYSDNSRSDCTGCPYADENGDAACFNHDREDALHYLKMLRDMTCGTSQILRNTSQITCPKCHSEFVILPEENNPLTWEQLKQMEGKPVWVEYDNRLSGRKQIKYKVWDVIDLVAEDLILVKGEFCYQKDEFGDVWQAYRKERS